jgi:hypothetical protein
MTIHNARLRFSQMSDDPITGTSAHEPLKTLKYLAPSATAQVHARQPGRRSLEGFKISSGRRHMGAGSMEPPTRPRTPLTGRFVTILPGYRPCIV